MNITRVHDAAPAYLLAAPYVYDPMFPTQRMTIVAHYTTKPMVTVQRLSDGKRFDVDCHTLSCPI